MRPTIHPFCVAIAALVSASGTLEANITLGDYSGRHAISVGTSPGIWTESLDQTFDHPTSTSVSKRFEWTAQHFPDGDPYQTYFNASMTNTQSRTESSDHFQLVQRGDFQTMNEDNPRDDWVVKFEDGNMVTQNFSLSTAADCGFLFSSVHSSAIGIFEMVGTVRNEVTHQILGSVDFDSGTQSFALRLEPGEYSVSIARSTYLYLGVSARPNTPIMGFAHTSVDVQIPTPAAPIVLAVGFGVLSRRRR